MENEAQKESRIPTHLLDAIRESSVNQAGENYKNYILIDRLRSPANSQEDRNFINEMNEIQARIIEAQVKLFEFCKEWSVKHEVPR